MTDLPYGRGGSPLQNLILRGHSETKISALRINDGIDTGDIYLKNSLSLAGTAREIFERSTPVIHRMIEEIIDNDISPISQKGKTTHFKRRHPEESSIENLSRLQDVYDYIRMLDCEGYPNAFLETNYLKIEFSNASLNNNEISANVRITKK
jgi:methionyl-tRNA formyltransferase